MLIDAIKQHGKKQIEVKQKIRITDKTKKLKYRVDTFFIFPGALQITENNFKKEEFKHNLKCYLSLSEQSPSLSGTSQRTFGAKTIARARGRIG